MDLAKKKGLGSVLSAVKRKGLGVGSDSSAKKPKKSLGGPSRDGPRAESEDSPVVQALPAQAQGPSFYEPAWMPAWSVRSVDSAFGEFRVCRELICKGVLPRDREHIETLGSNTLSRMVLDNLSALNSYTAVAMERLEDSSVVIGNLKGENTEMAAALASCQNDLKASKAELKWRTSELSKAQLELAEEKKKNARAAAEVIEQFKASQDFADLQADFAAQSFVDGFSICKQTAIKHFPDFDHSVLQIPDEDDVEFEVDLPPAGEDLPAPDAPET